MGTFFLVIITSSILFPSMLWPTVPFAESTVPLIASVPDFWVSALPIYSVEESMELLESAFKLGLVRVDGEDSDNERLLFCEMDIFKAMR